LQAPLAHTGGDDDVVGTAQFGPYAPPSGRRGLEQLVAYVYGADPKNETDWLEWKTGLDLASGKGRFDASRHILGFSNRAPGAARRHAAGLAFLVLGVEPGNASGQAPMDPADLTAGIRTYVGTQGPVWAPLWITLEGVSVLVFTIEAPQPGDSIHSLQKAFDGCEELERHPDAVRTGARCEGSR
jgi:hypothetical protein